MFHGLRKYEKILQKVLIIILFVIGALYVSGVLFNLFESFNGKIIQIAMVLIFFYFLIWLMGVRCRIAGTKENKKK
ncbi:hypothetical protein DSECCO2_420690 [anaerobic digester metagenome]|jgi:hypothetical protein